MLYSLRSDKNNFEKMKPILKIAFVYSETVPKKYISASTEVTVLFYASRYSARLAYNLGKVDMILFL